MRLVRRLIGWCSFLLNIAFAQVNSPAAAQLTALERFAKQPTAHVTWSKEVARVDSAGAQAAITAVTIENAVDARRQMRGIRIDLTSENLKDQVYVGEEFLDPLLSMLEEVAAVTPSPLGRSSGSSRCFGSGALLSAMREGAHFFYASQCSMTDGWIGLSVTTNRATFRFSDLNASHFASAVARARDELKQR